MWSRNLQVARLSGRTTLTQFIPGAVPHQIAVLELACFSKRRPRSERRTRTDIETEETSTQRKDAHGASREWRT